MQQAQLRAELSPHDGQPAPFVVRGWRVDDLDAVQDATGGIAPDRLFNRFLTGTSTLPKPYVRHVRAAWPSRWDAVVAVHPYDTGDPGGPDGPAGAGLCDGRVIGWAEAGRLPEDGGDVPATGDADSGQWAAADVAVVVVDDWQRRGVGTALVEALVARCQRRRVPHLTAGVLGSNVAAHRLAGRYPPGRRPRAPRAGAPLAAVRRRPLERGRRRVPCRRPQRHQPRRHQPRRRQPRATSAPSRAPARRREGLIPAARVRPGLR